mgnify:FL=1
MEPEAVEAIAQGRVWQGDKAFELGLVDALGDTQVAIEKAAELAELSDWSVRYLEDPLNPRDEFIRQLMESVELDLVQQSPKNRLLSHAADLLEQTFAPLGYLSDPRQTYVVCLECTAGKF